MAASIAACLKDTERVWMGDVEQGHACTSQCVGIVFPVYCLGPPNMVKRAVEAMQIPRDAYVFSVATMGSVPGACHAVLKSMLARKGVTLSAGWSIRMPRNYTPMGEPPSHEACQSLFTQAEAKAARIAAAVQNREPGPIEDSFVPLRWAGRAASRLMSGRLATMDRKFHAGEECSSCGTCERVCPVGNIRLDNGSPVWQQHCEQCFACLHWCPVDAIQWGHGTVGRKRYHHPAFKAADFFLRPGTEETPLEKTGGVALSPNEANDAVG